jgi:hypothetical protein
MVTLPKNSTCSDFERTETLACLIRLGNERKKKMVNHFPRESNSVHSPNSNIIYSESYYEFIKCMYVTYNWIKLFGLMFLMSWFGNIMGLIV